MLLAALLTAAAPLAAVVRGKWATDAAYGALVSAGLVAVLLWYSRLGWTQRAACGLGFDRRTPMRFLLGVVLGALLLAAPVAVLAGVDDVRWVRGPDVEIGTVAAAFTAYLLLSCLEELGFRSYPLLGLQQELGLWTAQAIVAMAFIAYHIAYGQPWFSAVVGTGLGSLLFGTAAVVSRGLALPIGLHAAWNFGSWALGDKGLPGVWTPVFVHPPGVAGTVAYVAAFLLWAAGLLVWQRLQARPSSLANHSPGTSLG